VARILVTGAFGFTGKYLSDVLESCGHEVHRLAARAPPVDALPRSVAAQSRVHVSDLCDAPKLKSIVDAVRPQRVAHLAAIAFVAHGDVDAIYRTNIVGTRNLLAALATAASRPERVLLASSANVYGNAAAGVVDESTAPSPANDYAVSKLAMEYMANLWRAQLPITTVRPFNYTGVGQSESFLIPKIIAHYKQRAPILELGNLDVERDFSDVRTVVRVYERLLMSSADGVVVNVCSGVGYSLQQVLDISADLTGHRPEVRVNPAFVRQNEVRRLVGSRARLDALIGRIDGPDFPETVRWMLD